MRKIDREALEKAYKSVDDLKAIRVKIIESSYELKSLDPWISGKLSESVELLNKALVKLAGI